MTKRTKAKKRHFRSSTSLILIPIIAAVVALYYLLGSGLMTEFANRGNNRLVTQGWQSAKAALESEKPDYGPTFAYYKLKQAQDLNWAAKHFSVSLAKLQKLNPGNAVWGSTIMVPPVEQPLQPFTADKLNTNGIVISQAKGNIYVSNNFKNPEAYVTMPRLMQLLAPYGVISQPKPKTFVINKPLYIQNNIRVDITSDTVESLLLRSSPNFDVTTLTFQNAEALIKGVTVSTVDPVTNKADHNVHDGRSFLRAYESSRMDIIDSTTSYLGMTLEQIQDPVIRARTPFVSQGGVYGVSWRISSGSYGEDIATGWVERTTFEHNHIGSFTFGASGMMWRNNLFSKNEVYGLDPHDDSNNATIEYNRFVDNGKHGFIVSKRCDHNVIKNNISVDNALHGFMLHEDSNYNVMEDNISIGNHDNFVIYGSNFNSVNSNQSYNPKSSHVRINKFSVQNYVTGNTFYGGKKGLYLYDGVNGLDISSNTFYNVTNLVTTRGASRVLFANNQSNGLGYQLDDNDRVVFGTNKVNKKPNIDLGPLQTINDGKTQHKDLTASAAAALKQ